MALTPLQRCSLFPDDIAGHTRNFGFFLRLTIYFSTEWYDDYICVFERTLWVVTQRKDVRVKIAGQN